MPAKQVHGDVVLITGFEANDPQHCNASAVLLEKLAGQLTDLGCACGGIEVSTRLMPGDTTALAGSLEAALDEQPNPTHLLLVGQAPGRNKVTLERYATNLRDFGTSDRHGNLPCDVPVIDEGPAAYRSTWPEQTRLVEVLNNLGIPAAMSNDAGNHLCNQLLYLALQAEAERDRTYVVTFVHIPVLPQQVIDKEPLTMRHLNCPYLPLTYADTGHRAAIESSLLTFWHSPSQTGPVRPAARPLYRLMCGSFDEMGQQATTSVDRRHETPLSSSYDYDLAHCCQPTPTLHYSGGLRGCVQISFSLVVSAPL